MAAMEPALMRFSISGRTQYLIVSPSVAPRWTSVTWTPARNSSSAASAAEFRPPTTTTRPRLTGSRGAAGVARSHDESAGLPVGERPGGGRLDLDHLLVEGDLQIV